ncbi:MAG: 16S rRNA (guanine(966)-N(2))-methyltransferase RsmD [Bacilli bacterium]
MRIIAGKRKGGKLFEVDSVATRSTTDRVKESVFNIIGPFFAGGVAVDFFAGSGSLCIEALSRGIDFAYFFDEAALPIDVINKNLKKFKLNEHTFVKQIDYQNALEYIDKKIDLIFLDPPYHKNLVSNSLKLIRQSNKINNECVIVCEIENSEMVNYEGFKLVDERVYGRVKIIILEMSI